MAQRLELQSLLENILGSENVYFQPPNNLNMSYPNIVYQRDDYAVKYADNNTYDRQARFQVTVIDRDPDSLIPDKIADLPLCSFDRFFIADNLNHNVFNLFF
jgi:hypothetical protein